MLRPGGFRLPLGAAPEGGPGAFGSPWALPPKAALSLSSSNRSRASPLQSRARSCSRSKKLNTASSRWPSPSRRKANRPSSPRRSQVKNPSPSSRHRAGAVKYTWFSALWKA